MIVLTLKMKLEDDFLQILNVASKRLGISRTEFARRALRQALLRMNIDRLEQQHQQGYLRQPVQSNEFSAWENEQV